jgi:hypothetical protein
MNDYQYKVTKKNSEGTEIGASEVTTDPKIAGSKYKVARANKNPGDSVELHKRTLGPWEIVEKS